MIKIAINAGVCELSLGREAVKRMLELNNKYVVEDIKLYEERQRIAKEVLSKVSEAEAFKGIESDDGDIFFSGDEVSWKDKESFVYFLPYDMPRNDLDLVKVIEELKGKVGNDFAREVVIVEVPDDVDWYVDQYDGGSEFVREHHRTWSYDRQKDKTEEGRTDEMD